jgi:hypothetical protein
MKWNMLLKLVLKSFLLCIIEIILIIFIYDPTFNVEWFVI